MITALVDGCLSEATDSLQTTVEQQCNNLASFFSPSPSLDISSIALFKTSSRHTTAI